MSEKMDLIVLGRKIGTYTGWDEVDTANFVFYEFEPCVDILSPGDLNVLYDEGLFQYFDDDGNLLRVVDMMTTLEYVRRHKDIPKVEADV